MSQLYIIQEIETGETLIGTICGYPESCLLRFIERGKEGWFAFQKAYPEVFEPTADQFLDWFEEQTQYKISKVELVIQLEEEE